MIMRTDPNQQSVVWSWIDLVRRRWPAGLIVFAIVVAAAARSVYNARPIYRAEARIRISEPPPSTGVGTASSALLGFVRAGGDPFANDLELLNSRTVAEAIVRDAGLNAAVGAPVGWYRDSLFSSFRTTDQTTRDAFEAEWVTPTRIEVRRLTADQRVVGTFNAGQPAAFGGLEVVFRPRKKNGPDLIQISTRPFAESVRAIGEAVKPARVRRDANVVEILYAHSDPALARQVVTSALQRFSELRTHIQQRESGQNVDSLRTVARHTLAELTGAEAALEELQRENMLVDANAQSEAFIERYSQATSALEHARSQQQAIRSVLQRAGSAETAAERWTKLLAYPPLLENPTIGNLLTRLNLLEEKRAELAPRRTVNNLEYSVVLNQIAYIDRSLSALAADIQTALGEQVQRLEDQVGRMEAALATVPVRTIELARRQRSARILSEVLVLTEQRLRQEELRQALSFSNIQVIDPPALQFKPVWPRKKLGVAVGILIGAFAGILAMALMERADRRVRRAAEFMELTGAPVLGVAVRSPAGLQLSALELRAVVHHASANGRGPLRVVLASVGDASTSDVAAALRAALPAPVADGSAADLPGPEIVQAGSINDFASASAATASGAPVALVVDAGRATAPEIARAASLITQAGGRIGGTIVLCKRSRDARTVWA